MSDERMQRPWSERATSRRNALRQLGALVGIGALAACDRDPVLTPDPVEEQDRGADGIYDVREFGAKGDDSHDDTNAIRAAIEAAGAGGRVNFPQGIYRCGPLVMLNGQTWVGASRQGSVLKLNVSGVGGGFVLSGSSGCTVRDVGLTTMFPAMPQAATQAIALSGQNHRVEACWIDNGFRWGGYIFESATHCGFVDCEIDGSVEAHGIEINDASYCYVERCRIRNAFHNGIELYPMTDEEGMGPRIVGCHISDCEGSGIAQFGGHGTVIDGNHLIGNRAHGIFIDAVEPTLPAVHLATGTRITNNFIRNSGLATAGHGIFLARCRGTIVQGNDVGASGNNGLYIANGPQSVVGNGFSLNSRNGVEINFNVAQCTLTSNICIDNSVKEAGAASGMFVGGEAHSITGNVCTDRRAEKLQQHGVFLACNDSVVTGNILVGNLNAAANLYDVGSGNVKTGNMV